MPKKNKIQYNEPLTKTKISINKFVENSRNAQVSDEEVGKFMKQLQMAKQAISRKRKDAYAEMNQALIMVESAKVYEKRVENTFYALQKGMRS